MFDEQIRQLEDKKSMLEEKLWLAYDFDTQFKIKKRIEDIESEIRELENEMEDEAEIEDLEVRDVIVEIKKHSTLTTKETPAYIGYLKTEEDQDVAFFSNDDLEAGERVKVEIEGSVPCEYDYLLGTHANGFISDTAVERLIEYLRELKS